MSENCKFDWGLSEGLKLSKALICSCLRGEYLGGCGDRALITISYNLYSAFQSPGVVLIVLHKLSPIYKQPAT